MCFTAYVYEKHANQCLRIYVAHTAFCVFIRYGSELCICVIKTFGYRRQSADDCLCFFVQKNMQLP